MFELFNKIKKPLNLVVSRTGKDCVACCIAMVCDVTYEDVEAAVIRISGEDDYHVDELSCDPYFERMVYTYFGYMPTIQQENEISNDGGIYVLTTASLNIQGAFHSVVLDCRHDRPHVLDPVGSEKLHYVLETPKFDKQVRLISWADVTKIEKVLP